MTNFSFIFACVLAINVFVTLLSSDWYKKKQQSSGTGGDNNNREGLVDDDLESKKRWHVLLKKYLVVYLAATLSDWFQGPYVYALYDDYGFDQHEIAVLFVAGFGSSMVFGSFIGGMADAGGRRNFVVLFSIIYALSCVTKHFQNYGILMIGRLLGGIATSLLFSVFESWLIRAHADANLKQYIGKSFSWAQYGNSIIAIMAGLIANKAADIHFMVPVFPGVSSFHIAGYIVPFDLALGTLVFCGIAAVMLWEENYGTTSGNGDGDSRQGKCYDGLKNAYTTTIRSTDICLCGAISSLFEGSMYIFVFMWTPALTTVGSTVLPFGIIFSTFMVCCMAGSSIFSIQIEKMKVEKLAVYVLSVAAASMAVVALSDSVTSKFLAMNVFEVTVGMYFPIMGTMKSTIVPESKRAAIYNLFRIPLNFIVLFSLLTDLTPVQSFTLNFVMLSTAAALQTWLVKRREMHGGMTSSSSKFSGSDDDIERLDLIEKKQEVVAV